MMNKSNFKEITKKIARSDRGVSNHRIMHPTREWGIGLLVGVIVFAATAGWGTLSFLSYRATAESYDEPSAEEVVVYRDNLVKAALEIHEEREEEHQQLLKNFSSTQQIQTEEDLIDEDDSSTNDADVASSSEPVLQDQEVDVVEEDAAEQVEETETETETEVGEEEESPELVPE